jgi:uncharacterized protein (TIGR02646 family)
LIRVERSAVPSPLSEGLVARVNERISEWYSQPLESRVRRKFDSRERLLVSQQSRAALNELFHNKCAYCESRLGASTNGEIDRFRPIGDASNLSGEGSPEHYTWLLADWENLFLACPTCSRSKRTFFPVDGERGALMSPISVIRKSERALLLDPCFDDPEGHLAFERSGFVQPKTDRGEITVKVLNLNRAALVDARRDAWSLAATLALVAEDQGELLRATASDRPYSAVGRAAVLATQSEREEKLRPQKIVSVRTVPVERRTAEEILASDGEAFRLTARPIHRVEFKNFRALSDVSLSFGEPGSEAAPWLMLLGENATGKTTLLQGIALALAGAEEARRLVRPTNVLAMGSFEGFVRVWFWDHSEPAELIFRRGSRAFDGTRGPSALVLGYGALRYAERKQRRNNLAPRFSRIAPLIQPIARIPYAQSWLLSLDENQFNTASRALSSVLPVPMGSFMFRAGRRILFSMPNHTGSLAELSAGYQTIVGMCADIMQLLFERWNTLSSANAIVLIDEIDAHLHPRWTMRIVSALREAFPQVQFIASTHNPLALRGLRNGEVALLRRANRDEVIVDQHLPPIEGLRVDSLLTSRIFGLNSTTDPEIENLLTEYYTLRSMPADSARNQRMSEIRQQVSDQELLGRSASERMMVEVAEEYIRSSPDPFAVAEDLKEQTKKYLFEIMDGRFRRGSS